MKKFYSQYSQDEWLFNNYFINKNNGVFVEIGADDGIDKSNTKFFEDIGWSGICIEPSYKRFEELKKNRNCILENCAVSDSFEDVEFLDISGWGKGLSGIVNEYNSQHSNRIKEEVKNIKNRGSEIITVKTRTLSDILEKNKIFYVDFCSIDTEGSEYKILKSVDFNKFKIKVIMVENNYNCGKIKSYLTANGYDYVKKLTIDDVYVLKNNV